MSFFAAGTSGNPYVIEILNVLGAPDDHFIQAIGLYRNNTSGALSLALSPTQFFAPAGTSIMEVRAKGAVVSARAFEDFPSTGHTFVVNVTGLNVNKYFRRPSGITEDV